MRHRNSLAKLVDLAQKADNRLTVRGFIYVIRNVERDKTYVGASRRPKDRERSHFDQLRAGKHGNPRMQADFIADGAGPFYFDILEESNDIYNRERYWIAQYAHKYSLDHLYNNSLQVATCFEEYERDIRLYLIATSLLDDPPTLLDTTSGQVLPASSIRTNDPMYWAQQYVVVTKDARIGASIIYDHYCAYCVKYTLTPLNQTAFGLSMRRCGYVRRRGGTGRIEYLDIELGTTD